MKQKKVAPKKELLLLEDVIGLGRSGDLVTAKPGFFRNFLLPQKKAVVADKHTLLMRKKLQEERAKRAEVDRKEAEAQALTLKELSLTAYVKVDAEEKMYGSVTAFDILKLLKEKGVELDRHSVLLPQPIKTLQTHQINLRLKEGVLATVNLEVVKESLE